MFTFFRFRKIKCKPQYFRNGGLNQKSLHQIPRTMSKEHTYQVSGHSSLPVLQEVASKLKKQSRDKTVLKIRLPLQLDVNPNLCGAISREGEVRLTSRFLHLVHLFQLYNILRNQNRAFLTPRLPPPSGLNTWRPRICMLNTNYIQYLVVYIDNYRARNSILIDINQYYSFDSSYWAPYMALSSYHIWNNSYETCWCALLGSAVIVL